MITLTIDKKNTRNFKGQSLITSINDYVIIDIETTGLDPKIDKIIEFAGIKVKNNKIIDTYSTLINPEISIDSFITNLTGITNQMLESSPTIENKISDILNFIEDDIIIGHNVNFDINFLYDNSDTILNKPLENDYIDTLRLCRNYIESENYKLQTMANKYNIDYTNAHRALKDCYITYDLYNILKEKMKQDINEYNDILNNFIPPKENQFKNKTIVFRGTFSNYNMDFVKTIGVKCNAKIADILYVNKTDFLILSKNTYLKYKKGDYSETLTKVLNYIKNGGNLKILSEDDFLKINNIPLKNNHSNRVVTKSKDFESNINADINNPFYKKVCVITGTLKISRKECMQLIANLGGINKDTVTKDTNYLILGNNDYNPILRGKKSNKLIKAESYKLEGMDIEIISENTFYDMIEEYNQINA